MSRTSSSHTLCALLGDDSLNYSEVDKKTLKEIEGLAEKIIENKKEGIDTEEEESEIDRIVYGLYDLSEEEIKIVESK